MNKKYKTINVIYWMTNPGERPSKSSSNYKKNSCAHNNWNGKCGLSSINSNRVRHVSQSNWIVKSR